MRRGAAVAALAVIGVLTGCGQKNHGGDGGSSGGSVSPSASASPSAGAVALPTSCTDVLTLDDLDKATGHVIAGQSAYIKGQSEPKIHRTGRITCRYGIHKVGHTVYIPVEVGISAYSDVGSASDRVQYTIDQQRSAGASPSEVSLGGTKATVLVSAGSALLVFAKDAETVAISVTKEVATGDAAKTILVKLGTAVLSH